MSFPSAQICLLISLVVESQIPFTVSLLPQAVVSVPPLFLFSCQHSPVSLSLHSYVFRLLSILVLRFASSSPLRPVSAGRSCCRHFRLKFSPACRFCSWFSPLPLRISQPYFSPNLRRASFSCVSLAASVDLRFSSFAPFLSVLPCALSF